MWTSFITEAVCLSLDKRHNQQERIQAEFAPYLDVRFFVAGDGTHPLNYDHVDVVPPKRKGYPAWKNRPNSYNAFLCFRAIIEKAKLSGSEVLLILEDDVTLQDFDLASLAYDELVQHDADWKMFYLGANHAFSKTVEVAPHLLKVNGSGCFHAVCVRYTAFDEILSLSMDAPIDEMVAKNLHAKGGCYACWPNVALTKPGFSYCEGREVNYLNYMKKKGCE